MKKIIGTLLIGIMLIGTGGCDEQSEGERCEIDGDCSSGYYCDKAPYASSGHCCPEGTRWGDSDNDGIDDACISGSSSPVPQDGGVQYDRERDTGTDIQYEDSISNDTLDIVFDTTDTQ